MVPADRVRIVGGGLAGSEAAWQLASRGVRVVLHEMRPGRGNPIHRTGQLAELVCSNSFKSLELANAHGLLKAELRAAGSLVMACAEAARLPAGAALAVDRELFAGRVTRALEEHPLVEVVREEVTGIPGDGPAIVAAGPLCSEPLARAIAAFTGEASLAFYDAISPVIEGDSIDLGIAFRASRYGKGAGTDYLNCPMTREEYDAFYDALMEATAADLHEFDRELLFEGCLPIEELALRGRDTLRFGPMKPVGLTDPRTGRRPWAVVQLRQDNLAATHWSMVGFQNRIAWGEQPRVFRMIPGLARAEFVKLGMIHRNTFINAPRVLLPTFQARARADLFFAGQISGVEGYTESTASGLVAGLGALALLRGEEPPVFPPETALGGLQRYVAGADPAHYQPTNIAFGLLPPLPDPPRGKRERKAALSERALAVLSTYLSQRTPPGRRAASAPAGHAPAAAPGGRG
jgi:methylenetetrahydrofolate--tRNA-(uracil-5-)-methyltransferase